MVDVAGSIGGVVSPVLEVCNWLAAPTLRQFKYLFNCTTNFKNLEEEVKKLEYARDEVQRKVTAAERNVEEVKQNVKDWQKDVEKTITEAEQLIQAKANKPRCFEGLCPNFIIHYKQSRKAFELKRNDIDPLLQQEKELSPVSYQTNPPEIWLRSNENYLAFESRNSTVKNVWDALNDENVYMIGIYGMGGLGKTTLVEEIGRKAEKDKLFEDIVFVEVSESPDVQKIQTTIANKLGLKFENESEMADKIYSRMKDNNILLILDNIWKPLELDKTVGIPCRADRGRNKLLFTTRNLDVLERMGSTNNFGMGILNEEEAWTLFTKMTGNIIQTHELLSLPNDVCKECGGLPIIICSIAKALKNKSQPFDWEVALQELKAPSPTEFSRFLEEQYMKIALSYKYLSDELKKTFLISSLMKNNASISDLFKHVVCLDILKGANLTIKDARNRLDKLIRELKDACLLLNGYKSGQFAMHDVIRVVALTIAYVDHHVFTTRNDVERDWKDKDKLKKCTKISLPSNSNIISQLWPNYLDCPNLEYFYMTNMWNSSFEIPEDFFAVMPKLKVLNLVRLQQSLLPSSIGLLTNLQTLCLDNSKIKDVVIGKLKNLKVLSLRGSYIKEFPTELTQLRLLDLSYCRQLEVIAPNVISKLSQLEELYLKGCSIQWKIEVLKELKLLSKLTSLELDIEDGKVLPKYFFSRELIRYDISVGNWLFQFPKIGEHEHLRILELIINPTIYLEELCGIKNAELLCLAEYLDDKDKDDLEHSKFNLQSNEITPLFNKKVIFPDLMTLVLKNIISRKIWDSQLPSSSFQNLKQLILWKCTKIKFVFPYTITKNLQQLQYLEIKDCIDLEEIVATEEITEAVASFVFPQATFLKLENLPELATFYPGIHTLEWPKLKKLLVKDCDRLKMFNSEPKSLCLDHKINHDLEVLKLKTKSTMISWSRQSKATEISFDKSTNIPLQLLQFGSVEKLQLHDCEYKDIKSVSDLPNLNVLHVWKCSKMVIFPDLKVLKLKNISPENIWDNQFLTSSYQNLTHLSLYRCYKIKYDPLSIAKSLQQLQYLELMSCKDLERIVTPEEGTEAAINLSFPQVIKVKLQYLPKFTNFYPEIHTSTWPKLKELVVEGCRKFKMFTLEPNFLCFDQKINHDLEIFQLKDGDEEIGWRSQSKCLKISYYKLAPIPLWLLQRFQNLTCLFVNGCRELVNLTTPSMAISLVQLRELKISNCEMLMEILEIGEDETTEIVFENLNKLSFDSIKSLICFCSGNHTFSFPSLEELNVKRCPNMKTFCRGILSTPKLHKINYWGMEVENEGNDLNKTIQGLYKKKNEDISLDLNFKCKVFHRDNSTEISYNHHPTSFYQNLTHLFLWECGNIKYVFPSSIAKSLHLLQQLKIQNCKVLEEIVAKEEGANAVVNFVFPNITLLKLEDLPELTAFYPGIYTLEMPKLKELEVRCCTNYLSFKENNAETEHAILDLKSIFLNNVINFNLEVFKLYDGETNISWRSQSKTLTINNDNSTYIPLRLLQRFENVRELRLFSNQYKDIKSPYDLLNLEVLDVYFHNRLMSLVPFSAFFQNLKVLKVNSCHGLMKLITPSMVGSLVQLRELSISLCKMLIEIIENEGDATSTEIVFHNLNKLSLGWLKSLTCFCSGNYSFSFPSLEELKIDNCLNLKIFCQGSLRIPKLDRVIYKFKYENVTEVELRDNDLNTTIQQEHKKQVFKELVE
ncbi:uncharacterized protein LOC123209024 isoform X2 [Mangifera indica]|uniref:uncharacterized protein LOC123209024 isoform X2 n=1 Tax=Mangifera indica TaxID=29780 RepID=UPI001CFB22CB|nr:uncharacterized protein LOC123209024 isoform X2 [Mangifera indica]